ncbi:hypothetical protein AGIG_G19508 [Arapaima gigas]
MVWLLGTTSRLGKHFSTAAAFLKPRPELEPRLPGSPNSPRMRGGVLLLGTCVSFAFGGKRRLMSQNP